MRMPLTEEHREHLRRVREDQLADWRSGRPQVVDEIFVTNQVACCFLVLWGLRGEGPPWHGSRSPC
jgi:hypothetical protein